MPSSELIETLSELQRQLEAAPELDSESRTLLERAVGEINDALGQESKPPDLSERLRSSVRSFEAEHPILTSGVNRVATMLSDMGI